MSRENSPTPEVFTAEQMTRMLLTLNNKLDSLTSSQTGESSKVDNRDGAPPETRKRQREQTPDPDNEEEHYEVDEEGGGTKPRTFSMSSPTKAFLKTAFCLPKPVDNTTRRTWLSKFGLPEGDETRCPKLDTLIKGELCKEALDTDKKLSRLQNFTLDAAGPIVTALEELTTQEEPNDSLIVTAMQQSLLLIGNASAQFAKERRTKALEKLNPDLKSLAIDEDFSEAQPYLFGRGFEKKAKERAEALDCLRKATSKEHKRSTSDYSSRTSGSHAAKRFFQGNRPYWNGGSGGGQHYRQNNPRYQQRNSYSGRQRPFPGKTAVKKT